MDAQEISISQIETDSATQFRVAIDQTTVDEYAQLMREGVELPPVRVISDGIRNWLIDGWHRLYAHKQLEQQTISAVMTIGTHREAVLAALSANNDHGLPTSNSDKRKKVLFALRDPELSQMSQREIAKLCGVTQAMVSKVKNEIAPAKGDNGYQLDDPAQVLELLRKDEKLLAEFLPSLLLSRHWFDSRITKRLTQLGLFNDYGSKAEWTPMAWSVLDLLIAGDDWLLFEKELIQQNNSLDFKERASLTALRLAKRVLEELAGKGWVEERSFDWQSRGWLKILAHCGYVVRDEVSFKEPDRWSEREVTREFDFYHLTVLGAEKLGIEFEGIAPQITAEEIKAERAEERARQEAALAARQAEWEAQQQQALTSITGDDDPYAETKEYVVDSLNEVEEYIRSILSQDIIDACAPHFQKLRHIIAQPAPEIQEIEAVS
ncbi:MAG: ParB N-terminal domain-containing protein [Anaerolineae bacterium]|nr:ParB N-terminal domain-containing protein [Anaerolineae bacterium]